MGLFKGETKTEKTNLGVVEYITKTEEPSTIDKMFNGAKTKETSNVQMTGAGVSLMRILARMFWGR